MPCRGSSLSCGGCDCKAGMTFFIKANSHKGWTVFNKHRGLEFPGSPVQMLDGLRMNGCRMFISLLHFQGDFQSLVKISRLYQRHKRHHKFCDNKGMHPPCLCHNQFYGFAGGNAGIFKNLLGAPAFQFLINHKILCDRGIQKLLDAVIEFMPSPLDIPSIKGTDLDGNEVERHSSDDEPFAALAFKIMTDPFVGKLAFFRVYSGSLNSGSYVLNATKGKKERVGRILQMHANKRNELDKVYSGDIAAAVGFKVTSTGDTICDEKNPVILESMEFPEPVIDIAIEPKTKASQDKMGDALVKLAEEDPTFRVRTDEETGQTIISGMGELHLDIIVDRLLREFNVEANVGAPQVAYKETFTKAVDVDSKYAKQSGGRGQYGHCKVHFTPMEANAEETFKFTSSVVGGAIPKEYIPAVGEGIEEACKTGILGGFPVLGVHADVYDGSYHEVDSSEMAFHIAGSMAFKEAMQKGSPILLEPIMKVEVTMPEEYMGDVIGDINSRRGRIEGMEDIGGGKMVKAYVPLSEMFGYSTDLRSRTQGRGNYSMFFEKYEPVPKNVQEKVLSDHKK